MRSRCVPALLLLAACTYPPPLEVASTRGLPALVPGNTRQEDLLFVLGAPSATYADGDIWSYKLRREDDGTYRAQGAVPDMVLLRATGWAGVTHALTLVWDGDGVLRDHSLLLIKH